MQNCYSPQTIKPMKSNIGPNMTKQINKASVIGRLEQLAWTALSANTTTALALAFLQMTSQASAATFSFSTGNPDGKIATLSRPSSPGQIQTETADDFLVPQSIVINQATFT